MRLLLLRLLLPLSALSGVATSTEDVRRPTLELVPTNVLEFHVRPDAPATIGFRLNTSAGAAPLLVNFTVAEYQGRRHSGGALSFEDGGTNASLTVRLPQGFFELCLGGGAHRPQCFGIISLPAYAHPRGPDPLFGVDGSLSWLIHCRRKPCTQLFRTRSALVDLLARVGIGTSRERLAPADIKPNASAPWDWEGTVRDSGWPYYDTLRAKYRKAGVGILEAGPSAVPWASAPLQPPYQDSNLSSLVEFLRDLKAHCEPPRPSCLLTPAC